MGKQASAKATAQRESVWRDRVARFSSSGQKVEVFCRDEGVSAWSFYQWRKRLGAVERQAKAPTAAAPFIDLGTVPAPPVCERTREDRRSDMEIRIELGGGIIVQIARR
jgi:hypothetical protein